MDIFLAIFKTIFGPLVIISGLCITIRHFKLIRTFSYIERFNSPSMLEVRTCVDTWLSSDVTNEKKIQLLHSDLKLHANYMLLYNLFTEVGIAYKFGMLHRKLTFEIWDPLLPKYWKQLEFYFEHQRSQGRQVANSFEIIAKAMINPKLSESHYSLPWK